MFLVIDKLFKLFVFCREADSLILLGAYSLVLMFYWRYSSWFDSLVF